MVTGKLDVRESADRLPHEIEEVEALDELGSEDDPNEAGAADADEVPEAAEA